jgi:hypothetical protein
MVSLMPASGGDLVSPIELRSVPVGPGGQYTFAAVPEGHYLLKVVHGARAGAPGESVSFTSADGMVRVERSVVVAPGGPPPSSPGATMWAELAVSVGGDDIVGADLVLRPALTVSGQVEWTGSAPRPDATAASRTVSITLEPADGRTSLGSAPVRGQLSQSGTFTTSGALPGRYFVRATGLPPGWFFRGATAGGADVSDVPLEISSEDVTGVIVSFTDRRTEVAGTVEAGDGASRAMTVLAFPSARDGWTTASPRRFASARVDAKGTYQLVGLPPGQYYVAAVADELAADWQNPATLESLIGSAVIIDLTDGQRAAQSLKVVR